MKGKIYLGIMVLLFPASKGQAQGTPTFFQHIRVSGDGARVVFEHSPSEETNALVEIYDAKSHRRIGQISRARRLILPSDDDNKSSFEFEEMSVEAVAPDGHHLLVRRLPLAKIPSTESSNGYNADDEALLESWNIVKTPRLEWRKRGVHFSDVKWIKSQIVVLLPKEVQRWNERGEIMSRSPFAIRSTPAAPTGTLSSDGNRAVICTAPVSVIETRTGRVLQKLEFQLPGEPVEFLFGPKNRFVWGHNLTPDEGFAPWDNFYVWDVTKGKIPKNSPQDPIFSPDGSAFWNKWKFRFESIVTGEVVPPRTPAAFINRSAFLQTISDDGRVWAGLTPQGKLFWIAR